MVDACSMGSGKVPVYAILSAFSWRITTLHRPSSMGCRRGRQCILVCLNVMMTAWTVHAAAPWSPDTFPNPQKDLYKCGRHGVRSMICDPDGIISYSDANVAEAIINKIGNGESPFVKAPCGDLGPRGYQVAVALLTNIQRPAGVGAAEAAKAFARSLHDSWGVGEAACQNGVLLLLALGDRQTYISTGAGAAKALDDDAAQQILENMKPRLRSENYGEAIIQAVTQIGGALAGQEPPEDVEGWWMFGFFAAVLSGLFGWAWWSNRKERTRYKACTDKLEAIKRDQAAIRRNQYAATTCPICFVEFDKTAAAGGEEAGEGGEGAAGSSSISKMGAVHDAQPLLGRSSSKQSLGGRPGSPPGPKAKPPLVLRCGHTFCEDCISEWVKKASNCPVCRKSLNGDDAPTSSNPGPRGPCSTDAPPQAAGSWQQQARWRRPMYQQDPEWALAEQMFRLRRLHMMYPDYITTGMLSQWEDDLAAQRDLDLGTLRAMAPATRRALESSGRSGTTLSFGGGGGGGGGGAGSSW